MIKQMWNISDSEKNRILFLHEEATKNLYLIKEQGNGEVVIYQDNFGNTFESGKYTLSKSFESEINQKVAGLAEAIQKNKNTKKLKIVIIPGESQVTNQPEFKEKGSLAERRAEELKKYLDKSLPNMVNFNPTIEITKPVIGQTPYNKEVDYAHKNDKKYQDEQFVKVKIVATSIEDYDRNAKLGEPIYLGNVLFGYISVPSVKTTSVTDSGIQDTSRQNLIFTEVKKDAVPTEVIAKYEVPWQWWNNERESAKTRHISNNEIQYIRNNFKKIS